MREPPIVVEHATAERELRFDEEVVVHAFNPSTYHFSFFFFFYRRSAVRLEQFYFVT